MRIGIDARLYGASVSGGIGVYLENLISELEKVDTKNEYIIFLRKKNYELYTPKNTRFKKVLADVPWYTISEQLKMPAIIAKEKLDFIHFPHFNVPLFSKVPFVMTLHDLILLDFPSKRATTLSPLFYKIKEKAYRYIIENAIKKSDYILTVSKYTKERIHQVFKAPISKITVTHIAPQPFDETILEPKTGTRKGYFLYVGNAFPHKNIEGLLRAYKNYLNKSSIKRKLVLVGKKNFFYSRLEDLAEELGLEGSVIFKGYVSSQELNELYLNAFAYVFPSFMEGFGIPPLEAMKRKIPVLSSDAGPMKEILGDAALYMNPYSKESISNAMILLEESPKKRESLINLGKEQIGRYSWEKCTKATFKVYKKMMKRVL